jgi:pectate lyase-like protein
MTSGVSTVNGGGAFKAADKVFQFNGKGTVGYPRILFHRIRLVQELWESVSRVVCHVGTTCCYCINSQERLPITMS